MLQGATYLDFITLAITNMVERLGLLHDADEIPASVDELEDFVDAEENVTPLINEDDGNFLVVGFKRRERLNVGTVPMFKMHHVVTVPTFKMHHVGTVPMFKMHHVGTVPTYKMHHVGTIKNNKICCKSGCY